MISSLAINVLLMLPLPGEASVPRQQVTIYAVAHVNGQIKDVDGVRYHLIAIRFDPLASRRSKDASYSAWFINGRRAHRVTLPKNPGEILTSQSLEPVVGAAISRWVDAGISQQQRDTLRAIDVQIDDLPGNDLGQAFATQIIVDRDAVGYGWFVDATPGDDLEFSLMRDQTSLVAGVRSDAYGKFDLLTVVMHEMGHFLDLDDLDPLAHPHDLMTASIPLSVRRLPADSQLSEFQPSNMLATPHTGVPAEFLAATQEVGLLYREQLPLPATPLSFTDMPDIMSKENRSHAARLDEQKTETFGLDLITRELGSVYNRAWSVGRRMLDDTGFEQLIDMLSKDQLGKLQ